MGKIFNHDISAQMIRCKSAPLPSPRHLVKRTNLLNNLTKNHPNRKLVLVQAPAGFGKTSLLLQYHAWSKSEKCLNCWLTLDSSFNDLNRFIEMLHATLKNCLAQTHTTKLIEHHGLIEQIILFPVPFKIFLDDFETIHNPAILQLIEQILDYLPEHGEIIIGSRNIPQINLGKIRVNQQVLEINFEDLKFTTSETEQILQQHLNFDLNTEDLSLLVTKTEGWGAAIQLVALALPKQTNVREFLNSFSGRYTELAEFLAEEILVDLNINDKIFMLKTSILTELDDKLCNWLTDRQDSHSVLQKLYKDNYFLAALDYKKTKFRYHGLFASFLKNQLRQSELLDINALHKKAADWYLCSQRPAKAIEHLLKANDQHSAIELLNLHAYSHLTEGRIRCLLKWFESFQPEIQQKIQGTDLQLIHAWVLVLNRHHLQAKNVINDFILRLDVQSLPTQRLRVQTLECLLISMTENIEQCHHMATDLLNKIDPSLYLEFGVLTSIVTFCMIAKNQFEPAKQLMSKAIQSNDHLKISFVRTLKDSNEGNIDLIQGRLSHARLVLEKSYEKIGTASSNGLAGGMANIGVPYAEVLYEQDDIQRADRILADSIPYARENGITDIMITAFILQSKIYVLKKEKSAALRSLKTLESIATDYGFARADASAKIEIARQLWLEGDFFTAQQLFNYVEKLDIWKAQKDYQLPAQDIENKQTLQWRLEFVFGRAAFAIHQIQNAITIAETDHRLRKALKLNILLCIAYLADQKIILALNQLTEVLQIASKENFIRILLDEGANMECLIHLWLKHQTHFNPKQQINLAYIKSLQSKINPDVDTLLSAMLFKIPAKYFNSADLFVDCNKTNAQIELDNKISKREHEVLILLSSGASNKSIAEQLYVSETTVKAHLRNIHVKLGAKSRTEAVAIARKEGFI